MKKRCLKFLHSLALLLGLRQILLLSGIALLAACSGKPSENESRNNDSVNVKSCDSMPTPDSSKNDSVINSEKMSV